MNEPIQLFKPTYRIDEVLTEIRACLEVGWTGSGFKTLEFEEAWKAYASVHHAHFLNSATAGLHLALHQLKARYHWRDGDEVITTPLSFVSTNEVILYENLRPVFADVDEYLCLDPESVERKITHHTKALIFMGMGGNTGRLRDIQGLCTKYDLEFILDAAHMAGTRLHGRHIGTYADVTVFSFQSVKNLPTADSGMICWLNEDMDAWSRRLAWMGIDKSTYERTTSKGYSWEYAVNEVGFKYHGNSIMAAMALVGLKYLDEDNARRNQIAALYDAGFENTPGLQVIPVAPDCTSSRHLYQVYCYSRETILKALAEANIGAGVHYVTNQRYPIFEGSSAWSNARIVSGNILSLPMHLRLTDEDVARIIEVVNCAADSYKPMFGRAHAVHYPKWLTKF